MRTIYTILFFLVASCGGPSSEDAKLDCSKVSCEEPCKENCDVPKKSHLSKSDCTIFIGNSLSDQPEKQEALTKQMADDKSCRYTNVFHTGNIAYGSDLVEPFLEKFSPFLAQNPQARMWFARGDEDVNWPETSEILRKWFPYSNAEFCKPQVVSNSFAKFIILDTQPECPEAPQIKTVAENLSDDPLVIISHHSLASWSNGAIKDLAEGWNVQMISSEDIPLFGKYPEEPCYLSCTDEKTCSKICYLKKD